MYSPWTGSELHLQLWAGGIDTLIITGGVTDVCVLAMMLGAIDWGFRVILVTDAPLQLGRRDPRRHDECLFRGSRFKP
ncbi:isochorismatase family protein [Bradyrhizobium elkanii]|uniref:isochorismatase family protein n=1 Tax=Bradyrhizobium elkanii TaxID=29448 RepID=UPI001FCA666D|nr:isochorismatase family protein [Bradyrhizobium elkanii]WLA87026.1 isochorismatase family protein [Bradyrhizobium elkanii]